MKVKNEFFDIMGVLQHHDAITGTEKQHVADSYTLTKSKAMHSSNEMYSNLLKEKLMANTGIRADSLLTCTQPQNETVVDCPQAKDNVESFLVIAHNGKSVQHNQFLRVLLPSNSYRAEIWSK